MTIVMVRHGETDWNREDRFQGHSDPPLNDRGRSQARALAQALGGLEAAALYSSPLARAHETAIILAERLRLEVHMRDDLREVDVGSWSGLTRSEAEARFPAGYRRWLEFGHGWDDGETYQELGLRVLSEVRRIAEDHPGERVVAVTHGGPIRSALAASAGVQFGDARRSIHVIGNCAVVSFAFRDGNLERVD